MSKFKKGDKVRLVKYIDNNELVKRIFAFDFEIGDVGIIKEEYDDRLPFVQFEHCVAALCDEQLELVEDEESK